ncbi:MAG: thiamine phosphate synthase [Peptococcaceae bacterium]|jgi:thiamine-phosphate pyrophosphorylase|nr:thiamine phosphate synthase [Peptococcaceae bacterium]MDH7526208.1 thiamine phosphate synthase [Peptococcaceae bacterium]
MNIDYSLYLATDRPLLQGRDLLWAVEEAILGGVTVVQLREKVASPREFYDIALEMKRLTKKHGIPLIINDRLDIMLAVDADGLHLGQDDLPLPVARRIIGPGKILGWSVANEEEARTGEKLGADYLGAGAVFATGTKPDAGEPIGLEGLRRIKRAVSIAVVGIGGINETNIKGVKDAGADGAAVISAIFGRQDIRAAARELKRLWAGHDGG